MDEPISVVPGELGPVKSVKSLIVNCPYVLEWIQKNPNSTNRVLAISLRFIMKILRFHLAWCLQKTIVNEIFIQRTNSGKFKRQENHSFRPVVKADPPTFRFNNTNRLKDCFRGGIAQLIRSYL